MEGPTIDPTDAGYDAATATNDGQDTIPTGVSAAEAGLASGGHGADAADVAVEDEADVNTSDNAARWSQESGTD